MESNNRTPADGQPSGDSAKPTNGTTKRVPPRDGHLFAIQKPKKVIIKGITIKGVWADMLIAYQTFTKRGTNDTSAVKRWRRVLRDRPDRFMRILEWVEQRWRAERKRNVRYREEYERRGRRIAELEAEIATLKAKNRGY
jgi:hypothetical protein